MKQRFGVSVSPGECHACGTVDALGDLIGTRRQTALVDGLPAAAPGLRVPLSLEQEWHWNLHTMLPDRSGLLVVSAGFELAGDLDVKLLRESVNFVAGRHDSLRTVFEREGGELRQAIVDGLVPDVQEHDVSEVDETAAQARIDDLVRANEEMPFDLERGPLARLLIMRRSGDRTTLHVAVHHIVFDLWSLQLFLAELSQVYAAKKAGSTIELPRIERRYMDFAIWQRTRFTEEVRAGLRAQWADRLEGNVALQLPYDRPRKDGLTSRSDALLHRLSPALASDLRSGSVELGVTPFTMVFAALNLLLYASTEQTPICVGLPNVNRPFVEVEPLIGFFATIGLVRTTLDDALPVRRLLADVVAGLATAQEYIPFADLVSVIRRGRPHQLTPPVQVCCTHAAGTGVRFDVPGLRVEPIAGRRSHLVFDLFLTVIEEAGGFALNLEYLSDLFSRQTVEDMVHRLERLLAFLLAKPDARVGEIFELPGITRRPSIAVAASFSVEPIRPSLEFWTGECGMPARVEFAGYNQVLQELLNPAGLLARNHAGLNAILIRIEDWVLDYSAGRTDIDWPRCAGDAQRTAAGVRRCAGGGVVAEPRTVPAVSLSGHAGFGSEP